MFKHMFEQILKDILKTNFNRCLTIFLKRFLNNLNGLTRADFGQGYTSHQKLMKILSNHFIWTLKVSLFNQFDNIQYLESINNSLM